MVGEPPFHDTAFRDSWLTWLRVEKGRQESSIDVYVRELDRLKVRFGAVDALTTDDLRQYLVETGGAPATTKRRIAALKSFYGFLVRAGKRSDDPTSPLDRPRVRRGLPRPVAKPDEAFQVLDPVTRSVAVLIRETGMRLGEACSIQCETPAPDALMITGKGDKDRLIPLSDGARAALDELGGRVPLHPRTIQRRFRAAGFTPHGLRHTFACEVAAAGADLGELQDLLGHASPTTTRVYAAYSLERLRRALNRRTA